VGAIEALLLRAIFKGDFQPGDPLPEYQLAKKHPVSQSTVREALVRLSHTGLDRRVPNRGTFVTNLSLQDVADRIRIRSTLELMAAIDASARAAKAEYDELDRRLASLTAAVSENDYLGSMYADLAFHEQLWAMSSRTLLPQILEQVTGPLLAFTGVWRSQRSVELAVVTADHQLLIDALRQGTPDHIEKVFRNHIEGSYKTFVSANA
jgi:DNA-binding GntR family transcriptional regulator